MIACFIMAALSTMAPIAGQAAGCAAPVGRITSPQGGQVIVNGQIVQTPLGQSLTLSTSGFIQVTIEHDCVAFFDLTVRRTTPGADPQVIHTAHLSGFGCEAGTLTEQVEIGLNGGSYEFSLTGQTCDGKKLRGDGHGGTVVDPPLPL